LAGDSREKWIINDEGKIKMFKDQSICVTAALDEEENNLCNKAKAEVSSDMNDGVHYAERAIDGTEDSYWASEPGQETAIYTVFFDHAHAI